LKPGDVAAAVEEDEEMKNPVAFAAALVDYKYRSMYPSCFRT